MVNAEIQKGDQRRVLDDRNRTDILDATGSAITTDLNSATLILNAGLGTIDRLLIELAGAVTQRVTLNQDEYPTILIMRFEGKDGSSAEISNFPEDDIKVRIWW